MATDLAIRQMALASVISKHHKADVLEGSELDVTRLVTMAQEISRMARDSGLEIEIITTMQHPHPAFRTSTLRVKSSNLCVLSQTV